MTRSRFQLNLIRCGIVAPLCLAIACSKGDQGREGDENFPPPGGAPINEAGDEDSLSEGSNDDGLGGLDDETGGSDEVVLAELRIEPSELVMEVDLETEGVQEFSVVAVFSDGTSKDVSESASLAVEDERGIASVDGLTLRTSPQSGTLVHRFELIASNDGRSRRTQVTLAAYRKSGKERDFFFVLDGEDDEENDGEFEEDKSDSEELTFGTNVKSMDVFFAMDTTGSMGGAIANLKSTLSGSIIPSVRESVADTQFGVGGYDDFPIGNYGAVGTDQPFYLLQEVTDDAAAVQAGVDLLTTHSGNDGPESYIEAAYQLATGAGLDSPVPTMVAPNNSGVGGVGFREGTMPVAVMITDAPSHAPGETERCADAGWGPVGYDNPEIPEAATREQAHDALNDICARVVSIVSGFGEICSAEVDGRDFAEATGAMVPPSIWDIDGRPEGCGEGECCTGLNGAGLEPNHEGLCHLVYRYMSNGTGVGTSVIAGLKAIARYAPFDVTTEVVGETMDVGGKIELPEGRTTADFIKAVIPDSHGPVPVPDAPPPIINEEQGRFERVYPGTEVNFRIEAQNDFLEPIEQPQVFRAKIRVLAGGCSALDEREVIILIPPSELVVVE